MEKLNLANYYLLPLVELSKSSFGDGPGEITEASNFINSYLDGSNMIVVKVRDYKRVPDLALDNPYYFSDIEIQVSENETHHLFLYRVTGKHLQDIMKFRDGKYSQFSQIAKDKISIFTGLKEDNKLIKVLLKDPSLKVELEQELALSKPIPEEVELKDLPQENNFIDIATLV